MDTCGLNFSSESAMQHAQQRQAHASCIYAVRYEYVRAEMAIISNCKQYRPVSLKILVTVPTLNHDINALSGHIGHEYSRGQSAWICTCNMGRFLATHSSERCILRFDEYVYNEI
jgi:hypothetical protein